MFIFFTVVALACAIGANWHRGLLIQDAEEQKRAQQLSELRPRVDFDTIDECCWLHGLGICKSRHVRIAVIGVIATPHPHVFNIDNTLMSTLGIVSRCNSLTKLSVSGNNCFPDASNLIAKSLRLKSLDVSLSDIGDGDIDILSELPELSMINMVMTRNVSDRGLRSLPNFRRLTDIRLALRPMSTDSVVSLSRCRRLETITLEGSIAHDADLSLLSHCGNLKTLTCRFYESNDALLDQVASINSLESLVVAGQFTRRGLRQLRKLPHLKHMTIESASMADSDYGEFALFPALESISVIGSLTITNEGISSICQMPTLRHLGIYSCNISSTDVRVSTNVIIEF